MVSDLEFKIGDKVVYPSHGIGDVIDIESGNVAGVAVQVYVISFVHEKMVLRVPVRRAISAGLRSIVDKSTIDDMYKILRSKAKNGNKMWSRRAQEYEAKINSGNILHVAEVVRDLYKVTDSDRSYSERSIYESALNRLASEVAVLESFSLPEMLVKLQNFLLNAHAA